MIRAYFNQEFYVTEQQQQLKQLLQMSSGMKKCSLQTHNTSHYQSTFRLRGLCNRTINQISTNNFSNRKR